MERRSPLIISLFLALWLPIASAGVRAPCSACKAVTVRQLLVSLVCMLRHLCCSVDGRCTVRLAHLLKHEQHQASLKFCRLRHSCLVITKLVNRRRAERAPEAPGC